MRMPGVIPKPMDIKPLDGAFTVKNTTRIEFEKPAEAVAGYLKELLSQATGFGFDPAASSDMNAKENTILLTTAGADTSLGAEGYELNVTPAAITIRAAEAAGLFYGVCTLNQLIRLIF